MPGRTYSVTRKPS